MRRTEVIVSPFMSVSKRKESKETRKPSDIEGKQKDHECHIYQLLWSDETKNMVRSILTCNRITPCEERSVGNKSEDMEWTIENKEN
jgi:hypothetical protein